MLFVCASVGLAWTGVEAGQSGKLAEIQAKIKQVGTDVKKLAEEKSGQIEALRRLEKQYGEQINALNSVKAEIEQQEQVLHEVRSDIETTQKSLHAQQRSLDALVRSAYVMGDKPGLDVLLNQRDPALSGRMLIYYNYIGKARLQKLQLIEENVQTLKRLESQKDTETQLLQVALNKKQQEADAVQALKVQRENLLARLNKEFAVKQEQLAALIHDQKKLEALVASLQKTDDNDIPAPPPISVDKKKSDHNVERVPAARIGQSAAHLNSAGSAKVFAQLQGKLPWPVAGKIIERFGGRRFETKWDGTVIGAREGADIHAVADGRVVFADWLLGYGLIIIVDHGKGYMSLYAFNQSLQKSVGDYVSEGDTLASVGRSGGRSQAALYFGIRVKGRAVDPEKWCRKFGRG